MDADDPHRGDPLTPGRDDLSLYWRPKGRPHVVPDLEKDMRTGEPGREDAGRSTERVGDLVPLRSRPFDHESERPAT